MLSQKFTIHYKKLISKFHKQNDSIYVQPTSYSWCLSFSHSLDRDASFVAICYNLRLQILF